MAGNAYPEKKEAPYYNADPLVESDGDSSIDSITALVAEGQAIRFPVGDGVVR